MSKRIAAGSGSLALYHFEGCPYCSTVRQAATRLGIEVLLRDIRREPSYRAELVAARGRQTVPVLRIEKTPGDVCWLPESEDIVRWLHEEAGEPLPAATRAGFRLVSLAPWLAIGAGLLPGAPAGAWLVAGGVVGLLALRWRGRAPAVP